MNIKDKIMNKTFHFTLSNGLDNESLQTTSISVSSSHFYFIGVVSLIMLLFPISWLVFFMPLTFLSLILVGVPTYIQPYLSNINIILPILQMLQKINILPFFITLHSIVFYTQLRIYQFFVIFCYGLTILYMLVGRYVFYHKVILHHEFSYGTLIIISTLLFISFCGSYLRMLINISNILVIITRQYAPELLDPLLRMYPPDFPPGTKRSLFSFSRHTHNHNHNHYPPLPKTTGWSRIGVIAACTGVAISSAALYFTRQQYLEAQKQTLELKQQNENMKRQINEIERQNDLAELSQGLITKEDYKKRHSKNQ